MYSYSSYMEKKIRRAFAQGVSDHQIWTTIEIQIFHEIYMEQFSILNLIFSPIYIFKQKLEQLLQHVFEQLFLARTILDSVPASGSLLACS